MNENILKLLEMLDKNEDLLKEFGQKRSLDELYEFSLSIADGYTKEEFIQTMRSIADKVYNQEPDEEKKGNTSQISSDADEDMGKVSGGGIGLAKTIFGGRSILGLKNDFDNGQMVGLTIKGLINKIK